MRDRGQYRGGGSLEGWVWRIAFRTALRARSEPTTDDLAEASAPPSPERDPELAEAIRNLPPRRRLALFLRYFADLSYAEIASLLEISAGTVAATLAHAHADLQRELSKEEASR
ncbi:MAG: RNA polymerase sigma factor [Gaiellaceae bacterium]